MKIPQLVQEIIDYYLYLVPWKARIRRLNIEYMSLFKLRDDFVLMGKKSNPEDNYLIWTTSYNWRSLESTKIFRVRRNGYDYEVALLPYRYHYSNTKGQLKSLYF